MKKLLTVFSAMLLVGCVVAATAIAHGSHKGYWNGPWHGWKHGNALVAVLAPTPAGPTGATGVTGETGATGPTDPATAPGVWGVANARQNKKFLKVKVGLRGLTPGAVYTVGIYEDVDGQGCASTTNALLTPPGAATVTATAGGYGRAKLHIKRSVFQLDRTKTYYVQVNNAAGASVSCGTLVKVKKHKHGHGKAEGHSDDHGNKHGHGGHDD